MFQTHLKHVFQLTLK